LHEAISPNINTSNVSLSVASLVESHEQEVFELPLLLEAAPIGIISWPKGS